MIAVIPVKQKRSRLPRFDWMPGRGLAGCISDAGLRARVMRPRLLLLMTRPTPPSPALGVAVGAGLLVVETAVVIFLKQHTNQPFGTFYMLGVLVVSTVWGLGLSVTMSVASAVCYTYFRNWPETHFGAWEATYWISMVVFLVVALLATAVAGLARIGERFFGLSWDLLCIAGPDRLIRVNRAHAQTLGYSQGEIASQRWMNLVAPEDRDHVRSVAAQLPGSTEPVRLENRVICKDGSRRWIEWNVVWHQGLAYAIGRDFTERRHERDQLRQTQAMLEVSRDGLSVLANSRKPCAGWIAHGVAPSEVYSAVAEEMVRCLDCDGAAGKLNLPVQEISQAADVGIGSFYNHFESKEQLFQVAVNEVLDAHGALWDSLTASVEDPAETFALSYRLTGRLFRRRPDLTSVLLNSGLALITSDRGLGPRALVRGLRGRCPAQVSTRTMSTW
jgi:PAS domain S-box-containing protein